MIKNNENGFLIEQENYLELSERILELLNNRELIINFGRKSRDTVENEYDWDKCVIPKYLKIYKKLIKE